MNSSITRADEALTVGSLFSGYGGLDLAIDTALGPTRTAWVADIDRGPRTILAHHWPHVPNLGDVTAIDWSQVEPVDIVCGGSPCQDLSVAGRRAGMSPDTRSGLWGAMLAAIAAIQPRLVVWENVSGARSAKASSLMESIEGHLGDRPAGPVLRALGRVLGDLANVGYDAQWCGIRAADAGAPHSRFRIFVVAYPIGLGCAWTGAARDWGTGSSVSSRDPLTLLPTSRAFDYAATPGAPAANRHCEAGMGSLPEVLGYERVSSQNWGKYAPAIRQWGLLMKRPAPEPVVLTKGGRPKLSARFAEWHMGLPEGWVTDVPGISMSAQIKALGNGVVPQQGAYAINLMARREMEMSEV